MIEKVFAGILAFSALVFASANAQGKTRIIHAGSLLTSDGMILSEKTIVIRGKYISSVDDGYLTPADIGAATAEVFDLSDYYILPGFIDTHVHLTTSNERGGAGEVVGVNAADMTIRGAVNAKKALDAGFTTVMDLGNGRRVHEIAVYAVRDSIQAGVISGPEIMAAGSPVSMTGFSRTGRLRDEVETVAGPEAVCDSPDECRFTVREQVFRGADFINVYTTGSLLSANSPAQTFANDEMTAIAAAAKSLNRVVISDGGNNRASARGVNAAIEAGFAIVDTVTFPDNETFDLLKKHNGFFSPHIYALDAAVGDTPATLEEGSMGWLPRPVLEELFALKQEEPPALAGYEAGAILILGSDAGVFPHGENAHEIVAYVRRGIPARTALTAATINAARAFQIDDRTGSIEQGKEADLIALTENPLTNIDTVLDVRFVMSDGRVEKSVEN